MPKRPENEDSVTFRAVLEPLQVGVPFYALKVPARASAVLGEGRVHVRGTVNGVEIRTSLLPVTGGGHKLLLNRRVRDATGLAMGSRVDVVLARNAAPHEEPMPDDLVRALRDADALEAFQGVARSTRNELMRWIEDARTEPTREKRIQRAVERALAARDKQADRQALLLAKGPRRKKSGDGYD
jgi:hypothetical protein